ncbi:MAG: hypothetical protein NTZ34_00125 [Chloroflexi bacterium]|nr:hypothetical protein [Chloroflexota bacterium]
MAKMIKPNNDGDKNKIQWWKVGLCAIVVLLIAGVITYTLMTRTSASSATPTASSPTAPAASSPASATINSTTPTATAANAPATDGTPNWVKSLDSKWETNDIIFVLFPGDADLTSKADQTVKSALIQLKKSGAAVDGMTLSSTDPEFRLTLEQLAIQKLPAVLILKSTGQGGVIKGDITETKLLQGYLSLTKSTCAPGAGPGCCPK